MTFIRKHSAVLTMAAGAAFAAAGAINAVHPMHSGESVDGLVGRVSLAFFAASLLLVAPGFLALGERARSTKAAKAAAIGTALLGLTCITSVVNGHDLVIFKVVAPISNALWLFGSIGLAVSLKRAGRVPRAVYIGLPIAWIASIPMGSFGGTLIAGAYWMAVGYLLYNERPAEAPAAGARA